MQLREAIEKSFDLLDRKYNTKWGGKKNSRESLINAFSQTEHKIWVAAGYSDSYGIGRAMSRALGENSKPAKKEWRGWLLYLQQLYLCRKCNLVVKTVDMYKNATVCKICDKKKGKIRRNTRRQYIYDLYCSTGCKDCGERNPIVLEFDHIDPSTKVNNIADMMTCPIEVLKEEIAKCEVVCSNCHKIRTAKTQEWYKDLLV